MPRLAPRAPPFARLQDRIAGAFGISAVERSEAVAAMLTRTRGRASYWLQLVLAMTIATLGLVLDSTAVVIGAMLISPLMGPIVELGMGLAVGSPFLVLRSLGRTASSVFLVVVGASTLTLVLPFHEVTREIAARTAPTALDLGVAICCAIAAAYALARPASETAATAAGTAVGIALVPPLCVIGYGMGTRSLAVAGGASLLFVANLCAIVFLALLAFMLLGYGRVDVRSLEREELARRDQASLSLRVARWLARVFASAYGPFFRVLLPLALLAGVYLPLRKALAEVSWQVRVRAAIEQLLTASPEARVHSTIAVEKHNVVVRVVAIGSSDDGARLRDRLATQIAAVAGVVPTVDVVAVPDDRSLRALAAEITPSPRVAPPAQPPTLADARLRLAGALGRAWPTEAAGALVGWRLSFAASGRTRIQVIHLGPPLGSAGTSLLADVLVEPSGAKPEIVDTALPATPVVAADRAEWVASTTHTIEATCGAANVRVCLEVPKGDAGARAASVVQALPTFDPGETSIRVGERWASVVQSSPCFESADAGMSDAESDAYANATPTDAGAAAPNVAPSSDVPANSMGPRAAP